ncbi:MAG: Gfo/Idh/MocA family oxidoreductase [Candidatus Daviesbacteria bacterium]|nr:Gfo/Idh/MocA family oxidoreductase [Candidatus Daviesbacteria bacterium]
MKMSKFFPPKIKTAVIGVGYWGPNFIRNLMGHDQAEVIWACDLSDESLKKINKYYPNIKLTKNYQDILSDKTIDLLAIATPPQTHFQIAYNALKANKHIIVAKPLATKSQDAKKLINLAQKKGLLLHCDLTYLYTGAIKAIKDLTQNRSLLGEPLYYDSTRSNLGLIQQDINVIWDLVPHDLAILIYCFNLKPTKIFCTGSKHHGDNTREEMAHITINYSNNFIAHIHVSWISPVKLRTILIGGTKKMIFYDDVEPDEKVKIYDRGISLPTNTVTPFKPIYRSGKIVIPKLENEEALYVEIDEVIKQILNKKISYENAKMNIEIISLLEACDESIQKNKPIILDR